ncbi:Flexible cuticle protein 12 [Harpegnathos saltator]|uniref:Flexible cuticle protein 12 n=1 Tax=Harpegnathos saltator TaxID=610380 RepID=E2C5W7_HARSA|nr:Flexible cuticle protein 12 [Harpegnathos saltator]
MERKVRGESAWAQPNVSSRRSTIKSPLISSIHISLLYRTEVAASAFNMKTIIALFALVAVAVAAPVQDNSQTVVVKETPLDNIGIDGYQFGYELSNGESREESAQLVNAGTENASLNVRGSFSFVDPATNARYTVNYVADENGYHPEGEHLPA